MLFDCAVCFDSVAANLFVSTSCGHSCCQACMADHLRAACIDTNVCKCFGCSTTLASEEILRLLLDCDRPDLMGLFGDRCLDRMMGALIACNEARYCPDCNAAIVGGCSTAQFWTCFCGTSFCQECMVAESKHSKRKSKCGTKFALFKSAEEKNDLLFQEWVSEMDSGNNPIKSCPKCYYLIQKSEGCNHMTCTRCSHEFCFLVR